VEWTLAAGKYGSDGMIARRRRIIETALDLMGNNKGEFTMRDLAQASNVATGTLYNLFGSQDALVAEAVVTVFEERVDRLVVEPEGDNIADLVRARGDAAYKEIMRVPAYAKTMVKIYFAGEPGSPVRKKLHEIPKTGCRRRIAGVLGNPGASR
jgi:AcrR family transcriptional regulator